MNALNREIADAFSLLGVLLVFVFLLFSIVWQQVESLNAEPNSDDDVLLTLRLARYERQRRLLLILMFATLLIVLLVIPLSRRVICMGIHFDRPFNTIGAGLILVDVFLIALIAGCLSILRIIKKEKAAISNDIYLLNVKLGPDQEL